MNTTECLIAILSGLAAWYISIWVMGKYDSRFRSLVLFVFGLIITFYGFGELVHYKELDLLQLMFAIAMGVLYSLIVIYAIGSYLEKRKENEKKRQAYLDSKNKKWNIIE